METINKIEIRAPDYNTKYRTKIYTRQLERWGALRNSCALRIKKLKLNKNKSDDTDSDIENLKDIPYNEFPVHKVGDVLLIYDISSLRYDATILNTYINSSTVRQLKGKSCKVNRTKDEGYNEFPRPETFLFMESEVVMKDSDAGMKKVRCSGEFFASNYLICPESPNYNPSDSLPPFIFIPNPKNRRDFYKVLPSLTKKSKELEGMIETYLKSTKQK